MSASLFSSYEEPTFNSSSVRPFECLSGGWQLMKDRRMSESRGHIVPRIDDYRRIVKKVSRHSTHRGVVCVSEINAEHAPMESKETVSQEELGSDSPKPPELAENASEVAQESTEERKSAKSGLSYTIPSDVLLALIGQRPEPPRFQAISNNPLIGGVIGILIGGIIALYSGYLQKRLESQFGERQQELTHRLSFSDEVNKLRMQKVGEVWERLDQDEFIIDTLLESSKSERPGKTSNTNNQRAAEITRLIQSDQAIVSKYRFWLGEDQFQRAVKYLDINIKYSLNELGATVESDSSKLRMTRKSAKEDILHVRSSFLQAELPAMPKTSPD